MIGVSGLSARRGRFAIQDVGFDVRSGGLATVVGPAGCGKTTMLEAIAGLIPLTSGRVALGDVDVTNAPPESRRLSIVYQHAYLFPHLDVRENVVYGAPDTSHAMELADRFGVAGLGDRHVGSLSGGERQLVAITRALARRPSVLLLDEPFAALDPRTRVAAQRVLRVVHAEEQFTVLHVTHDFTEAASLGDLTILMDRGRVVQAGPPATVFGKPANPFAASFLGAENILAGVARPIRDTSPDWTEAAASSYEEHAVAVSVGALTMYAIGDALPGPVNVVIRAEEVALSLQPAASSIRNQFTGRVTELVPSGAITRVSVDVSGTTIVAAVTSRSVGELQLQPGREVTAAFKATAIHLC